MRGYKHVADSPPLPTMIPKKYAPLPPLSATPTPKMNLMKQEIYQKIKKCWDQEVSLGLSSPENVKMERTLEACSQNNSLSPSNEAKAKYSFVVRSESRLKRPVLSKKEDSYERLFGYSFNASKSKLNKQSTKAFKQILSAKNSCWKKIRALNTSAQSLKIYMRQRTTSDTTRDTWRSTGIMKCMSIGSRDSYRNKVNHIKNIFVGTKDFLVNKGIKAYKEKLEKEKTKI